MRQVVEIDLRLWQKIQSLLSEGRFESLSQLVSVAIENQIILEAKPLDQAAEDLTRFSGAAEEPEVIMNTGGSNASLLQLRSSSTPPSLLEKAPEANRNEIAWGLYNRIFPVKITVRVLSQLLSERNSGSVDLKLLRDEAAQRAKEVATLLGAGRREKRSRPERLYIGLPFRRSDKSTERFKNMFVGSVGLTGKSEGFPALLGFVVLKRVKGRAVASLTDAGYAFERLENPVLDREVGSARQNWTLSEKEGNFYLAHIKDSLPREWELCARVVEEIGEGVNTTEGIDQVVRKTERNMKPGLVPPTRSGIISRMGELGLVQRRQDGLRVMYALTERGEAFLQSTHPGKTRR